ncbi:MAG: response regulator transcription factor [Bacteroidetes bacterium]|nr:response regulator transcription factor [Bacteroidota bacterium]
MIRCAIVDDEPMSRLTMTQLVRAVDDLEVISVCTSASEAAAALRTERIDLLLLDIEMPGMSGIELIRSLTHKPEVVLVTSNESYAVEAFECDVADYLVKPVSPERFRKALAKVRARIGADEEQRSTADALFVKVNGRLEKIGMTEILWVEALGDYVTIRTEKGAYTVHSTMKGMENRLPADQFLRVHRSHIVRLEKIKAIEESLLVIGKDLIPVGDSYRAALMKHLTIL